MKNYQLKTRRFTLLIFLFCFSLNQLQAQSGSKEPIDHVNPYMGNISHLLVPTFPTIHLPNSLLRVYPERPDFTGDLLKGLPLIVTSHRGSSAFNLSPFQGEEKDIRPVIFSSYDNEKLTPYSYSVYLDDQQTEVSYGLSHQSAMYEIDFEKDDDTYLILNSKKGSLKWDGKAVSGYQSVENNTRVYIYLSPEVLPESVSVLDGSKLVKKTDAEGRNACIVLKYPKGTKSISLQYGISFIDADQAKQNMEREVAGKDMKLIHAEARQVWNKILGKLKVNGGTDDKLSVFYTSLYRSFERPVCISEGGRYYSAFDGTVHKDNGRPFYTDDWIWDSYRAHHPLNVLIESEKENDILNSFVQMAEQMDNFWMPTFPEITGDSRRMNSNHGVASIIDAYSKGLRGFDLEKAYKACKGAITEKTLAPWSGMAAGKLDDFYKENGYIPALKVGEKETIPEVHSFENRQPVAVTLGTSYDEWCLSQIAGELGLKQDAEYFKQRSFNYRNLYNKETGFFHPKDSDGKFIEPFDYDFPGGMGAREYYGENNGWVYRWDVQHNISDLIDLMGGNEKFINNLNTMFTKSLGMSKYQFYAKLPDHTGNVGQFSMANEPSLHIPYLYNYAGQPWKTQKRVSVLLDQWFRNDLMGVPGDEDGGGMSAFVVFSCMGIYPVTPGSPVYSIGSPQFGESTIKLENGNQFTIIANNRMADNKYIQSATLNGKDLNRYWITHQEIAAGGTLTFEMGDKPNYSWGVQNILSAHAHNDYGHTRPLFDALDCKFKSIEADGFSIGDSLFVAHDFHKIAPGNTLRNLYLNPLKKLVEENNGSVYGDGSEVILFFDIKDDGLRTYKLLHEILEDYSEIITSYKSGEKYTKAISVIVSGNRPLEYMKNQELRYAGYDGRIPDLDSGLSSLLMPLVSDNWNNHFKWKGNGEMPQLEKQKLSDIVSKAKKNGYMLRFWATPDRSGVERENVWNELRTAGVDLIGTDDLKGLQSSLLSE